MSKEQQLPYGVKLIPLHMHYDHRGMFAELYRKEWHDDLETPQWNISHSKANVLRGVHLHCIHTDYLIVLKGHMILYLHDVRPDSQTKGKTFQVNLRGDDLQAVIIPTGVAHGFYFAEDSTHIYAVSDYWNPEDEMGCMWNSPELGITWPSQNPMLSERDESACSYDEMLEDYFAKSKRETV